MLKPADRKTILSIAIFKGISGEDLDTALEFLHAHDRSYGRDEMIFLIGDPISSAGIILEGSVELSFMDENSNNVNMNHFIKGSVFGEALACAQAERSPMQMRALTDCRILFFDFQSLFRSPSFVLDYQAVLIRNLLRDFSRQNVFLNQKVRIMSQKLLRDRLRVYLSELIPPGSDRISLRFNRSELAEFLGVNRSALSRELSRMQEEGLIAVSGTEVRILHSDFLIHH